MYEFPKGEVLWGAEAIRDYINEISAKPVATTPKVYGWAERSYVPVEKVGAQLTTTKSRLRKRFGVEGV